MTSTEALLEMQQAVRRLYVDPSLMIYAVKVVAATRNPEKCGLRQLWPVHPVWRIATRLDLHDRGRTLRWPTSAAVIMSCRRMWWMWRPMFCAIETGAFL